MAPSTVRRLPIRSSPRAPGPLEQCTTALVDFRSCMSFAFWEVSGIYDIPNQNSNGGRCYTCHTGGGNNGGSCLGGACLPQDARQFFDAHAESDINIVKLGRCVIDDGEFLGLALADRFINKGQEGTVYSSGEMHPTYAMQADRRDGHDLFMLETINAAAQGLCAELDQQYIEELNNNQ